jgi:hypothetical protein
MQAGAAALNTAMLLALVPHTSSWPAAPSGPLLHAWPPAAPLEPVAPPVPVQVAGGAVVWKATLTHVVPCVVSRKAS